MTTFWPGSGLEPGTRQGQTTWCRPYLLSVSLATLDLKTDSFSFHSWPVCLYWQDGFRDDRKQDTKPEAPGRDLNPEPLQRGQILWIWPTELTGSKMWDNDLIPYTETLKTDITGRHLLHFEMRLVTVSTVTDCAAILTTILLITHT